MKLQYHVYHTIDSSNKQVASQPPSAQDVAQQQSIQNEEVQTQKVEIQIFDDWIVPEMAVEF